MFARPQQEVLDIFYDLADLNSSERFKAISNLVMKVSDDVAQANYCIDRLVAGLSSHRAAARFGYAAALTMLLETAPTDEWSAETLLNVANKKLDTSDQDKKLASGAAVGQHLLCSVMASSPRFKDNDISLIVERELTLLRQFPFLAVSVAKNLAELSLQLKTKVFKAHVMSHVKGYLEGAILSSSPEFLYFALLTRKKHSGILHDVIPQISADGSCAIEAQSFSHFIAALKKCDTCFVDKFVEQILICARESERFEAVYKGVLEKWAIGGDETKALQRLCDLGIMALRNSTDAKEVSIIFSLDITKRISSSQGKHGSFNIVKEKVSSFCSAVKDNLDNASDVTVLWGVVTSLESVSGCLDFPAGAKLVDTLLGKLDKYHVVRWVEGLSGPNIRRVCSPFAHWSKDARAAALDIMMSKPASDDILHAVASSVDSLFYMNVRTGESVVAVLSEDNEQILSSVAEVISPKELKSASKKFSNKNLRRPLSVLWMCLRIWKHLATSANDKKVYTDALSELVTIGQHSDQSNITTLIDMLISLLSHPHKYHKTPVFFTFVSLLPLTSSDDLKHIVETLLLDDSELGGDGLSSDADIDDDDELEDDEHLSEEDDSGDEVTDSDRDDDSESASEGDVDEAFVSKLEEALGKGAIKRTRSTSEQEESDIPLSDMDDEEMFAMDEKLAAAFKAIGSNKKNAKSRAAELQSFRTRIADLLLFAVSSSETPSDVRLSVIIPLISLIKVQMKRSTDGPCVKKTIELLGIISRMKKVVADSKHVCQLISQVVTEASGISNPSIEDAVAAIIAFLFHLGVQDGVVNEQVKQAVMELFHRFISDEEGKIGSQIATSAIMKYPGCFVTELSTFLEIAFNENHRIFRRTETLSCIANLLMTSVMKDVKINKESVKQLGRRCSDYLKSVPSHSAEVKPRFLAGVLRLLLNAVNSFGEKEMVSLSKELGDCIDDLMKDDTLVKNELKKCNQACIQICGKQCLHVLKAISKKLV